MEKSVWTHTLACTISSEEFWTAVKVWIEKPHVVNRRLWGTTSVHSLSVARIGDIYEAPYLSPQNEETITNKEKCLEYLTNNYNLCLSSDYPNELKMSIIKQLPKSANDPSVYQLVVKDFELNSVYFTEIFSEKSHNLVPRFPYSFHLDESSITLKGKSTVDDQTVKWLKKIVLPSLVKWAEETSVYTPQHGLCSGSLTLVDHDTYHSKYNELKRKYGKEMVKIWPECTDPAKFVYEDVAIASYLLVLWECERKRLNRQRLQSFVDLGCGNGLLVYILASEGYNGFGVDVRKRKIWDMYPPHVVLKEQTVSPSDMYLFPNTDWIIGNHSDELTPWIPVIAARSSYTCNFFLLPCCCYNFNGTKFQRKNSSKSQYSEYLEYVHRLCKDCGFATQVDRLKIPSTKRICLVGTGRIDKEDEFEKMCSKIQTIISQDQKGSDWISDFKPREATERVKNCTRIDKSVINSIVNIISEHLMSDCVVGEPWSIGIAVAISQLVNLIPEHLLKSLKSECGGLQTLFRNHNHIFKVEKGKVALRRPQTVHEASTVKKNYKKSKVNSVNVKKRLCWFYTKHPQGCPLSDQDCSFIHCL